jgi:predicted membrane-bound spermidine synthase
MMHDAASRDIVSPSGQVNVSNVVSSDLLGLGVGGLLSRVFGDAPRSALCAQPLSLSMLVHVTAAEMAQFPACLR